MSSSYAISFHLSALSLLYHRCRASYSALQPRRNASSSHGRTPPLCMYPSPSCMRNKLIRQPQDTSDSHGCDSLGHCHRETPYPFGLTLALSVAPSHALSLDDATFRRPAQTRKYDGSRCEVRRVRIREAGGEGSRRERVEAQ